MNQEFNCYIDRSKETAMMQTAFKRSQVFAAIDSERVYQDQRWNPSTTTSKNEHSLEEWFMYMEDYINEAKHILSREARQNANPKALDIMRKVAALAVAAMEEHGAPLRTTPSPGS